MKNLNALVALALVKYTYLGTYFVLRIIILQIFIAETYKVILDNHIKALIIVVVLVRWSIPGYVFTDVTLLPCNFRHH